MRNFNMQNHLLFAKIFKYKKQNEKYRARTKKMLKQQLRKKTDVWIIAFPLIILLL